jgi:4-hydroxybenzoate polyprenyltransferase
VPQKYETTKKLDMPDSQDGRILRMWYLRLYESLQMLIPGFIGFIKHHPIENLLTKSALIYFVVYFLHVLLVFTYNDLCDWQKDQENPRKRRKLKNMNKQTLQKITCGLLILFLVFLTPLPLAIVIPFFTLSLLGVLYSRLQNRMMGWISYGALIHFLAGAYHYLSSLYLYPSALMWADICGMLAFGFIYLSGGLLNEVIDMEYDQQFGLTTWAMILEKRLAFVLIIIFQILALIFLNLFAHMPLFLLIAGIWGLWHVQNIIHTLRGPLHQESLMRFRKGSRFYFGPLHGVLIILLLY